MFHTQGNTQVYTPFGSYVVEQRDYEYLKHLLDDLPPPDVNEGKERAARQTNRERAV